MNNSQATLNNSQLESLTSLPAEKLSTVTLKKNMSQIMKELIDELPGWLSRLLLKLNFYQMTFTTNWYNQKGGPVLYVEQFIKSRNVLIKSKMIKF